MLPPASGIRYAIDSKFTRAVRDLAPRFEHRLFLSATPHNGHSNSFSALLEILDPDTFYPAECPLSRSTLKTRSSGVSRTISAKCLAVAFPSERTPQIDLSGLPEDQSELVLGRMLDEYRSLRMKKLEGASKRQQTEFGLLFSGLQQRLLSSVSAFSKTLSIHKRTMERIWAKEAEAQSNLRFDHSALQGSFDADDDRAELPDDEKSGLEEEAMVSASLSTAVAGEAADVRERELLNRMEVIARDSRDIPDARVKWLYSWIDTNMRTGHSWNDLRVIIFTEYEDTRRYLMHSLNERYPSGEGARRIEFYSGITNGLRTGKDQAGFQLRSAQNAAPYPCRYRRGTRRFEPSGPVLEPLSFRRTLEPQVVSIKGMAA